MEATSQETKSNLERLIAFRRMVEAGQIQTVEPMLPLLLNLKGKPYSLSDHYPFAPLFRTKMANSVTIIGGRQISKSTCIASRGVTICNAIPHFRILFVTPLYEQVRRLSNDYVRGFVEESPVRALWTGTNTENSVLQRSFKNFSKMYFSFALLDADRCRGLSTHQCIFDEIQLMNPDHIPIIKEVMSASDYEISWMTGTPLTEETYLETSWQESSQAEWWIRCGCGTWNIPAREYHILRMIGPLHDDISEERPGIICWKCGCPLRPRPYPAGQGRWVHRYPDKRWTHAGYHIPQIIMPHHYAKHKKWVQLHAKMNGAGNYTEAKFWNEVLGESYDKATKLVSQSELQAAASLPWKNNPKKPKEHGKRLSAYQHRCLGIDWGGGGKEGLSFTTVALLGWKPGGAGIDVIWGKRLPNPNDHMGEAKEVLQLFRDFKCEFLAHDYNGAGSIRETLMHHAGVPANRIIPIAYCRAASRSIMSLHASSRDHPRNFYLLDKARSLQLTCHMIKLQYIKFFQYDYQDKDEMGLLHDFLALIEQKLETARGGDVYQIIRNPIFRDDFAHSVNMGACAFWHMTKAWPNISRTLDRYQLSAAQLDDLDPSAAWQESDFLTAS
jgi:hypothetical protein